MSPLPKGMVFAPFRSENGYTLCPFWSGIGSGFRGNYRSVRTSYLSFQFQMIKKEGVIYDFEMDCKKSFIWRSYLSNEDKIF